MKEISLHILDIMHNSISAGASLIELTIIEDSKQDIFSFKIVDNGKGMSEEMLKTVTDPFTTGRTTRKVGLGIPLVKHACEITGGYVDIKSELGKGTTFYAEFGLSHIDRQPLGDIAETMHQLITSFENIDILYQHIVDDKEFTVDTKELKRVLDGVSFTENSVSLWLLEYLKEGEAELFNK